MGMRRTMPGRGETWDETGLYLRSRARLDRVRARVDARRRADKPEASKPSKPKATGVAGAQGRGGRRKTASVPTAARGQSSLPPGVPGVRRGATGSRPLGGGDRTTAAGAPRKPPVRRQPRRPQGEGDKLPGERVPLTVKEVVKQGARRAYRRVADKVRPRVRSPAR